jgi:hypothetical protein
VGDLPADLRDLDSVAAQHDPSLRRVLPDQLGHPLRLEEVGNDERDPDEVVPLLELPDEPLLGGEVEDRGRRRDVVRQVVEAEALVEEADREDPLLPGDLVVEQLHAVRGAPVGVVDAVRPEHRRQQDPQGK